MKKFAGVVVTLVLMASAASGQAADVRQKDNDWFKAGQEIIKEKMARTPIAKKAKHVTPA